MVEQRSKPFIKWVGGKRNLVPEIEKRLPDDISTYYEPFLGGGAVFYALEDRIKQAYLSDINDDLIMAYFVVSQNHESLVPLLHLHKEIHQKDHSYFYQMRKYSSSDPIKATARFIYLMKTCFRGKYSTNLKGQFNSSRGDYKNPTICDPDNLRDCSKVLQEKAHLVCRPFHRTPLPPAGSFMFCDPPYDNTYMNYHKKMFNRNSQMHLRRCIDKWTLNGAFVMTTNANTPYIREIYKDYNIHTVASSYKIRCKVNQIENLTDEVIITNY